MKSTSKHFHGTDELSHVWMTSTDHESAALAFSNLLAGQKAKMISSFNFYVGVKMSDPEDTAGPYNGYSRRPLYPATRVIHYACNPSKHKCDSRCRNAKGGNCECQCEGKFHGYGN